MFDLTDDVENSLATTRKVKPAEVNQFPPTPEKPKKETPKNDDFNEYEYSDDPDSDDSQW